MCVRGQGACQFSGNQTSATSIFHCTCKFIQPNNRVMNASGVSQPSLALGCEPGCPGQRTKRALVWHVEPATYARPNAGPVRRWHVPGRPGYLCSFGLSANQPAVKPSAIHVVEIAGHEDRVHESIRVLRSVAALIDLLMRSLTARASGDACLEWNA